MKKLPYDFNVYFFIDLPEPAFEKILEHTIESAESAAKLYDGSYLVKLPMHIDPDTTVEIPNVLRSHTAYTHKEMLIEKAIREQDRPII